MPKRQMFTETCPICGVGTREVIETDATLDADEARLATVEFCTNPYCEAYRAPGS